MTENPFTAGSSECGCLNVSVCEQHPNVPNSSVDTEIIKINTTNKSISSKLVAFEDSTTEKSFKDNGKKKVKKSTGANKKKGNKLQKYIPQPDHQMRMGQTISKSDFFDPEGELATPLTAEHNEEEEGESSKGRSKKVNKSKGNKGNKNKGNTDDKSVKDIKDVKNAPKCTKGKKGTPASNDHTNHQEDNNGNKDEKHDNDNEKTEDETNKPKVSFWMRARKIILSVWTASILCFCLNILYIAAEVSITDGYSTVQGYPIVGIFLALLVMGMHIVERSRKGRKILSTRLSAHYLWAILKNLTLFAIIAIIIGYVTLMISGTIHNPLNLPGNKHLKASLGARVTLIVFQVLCVILLSILLIHVWQVPQRGKAQIFMGLLCFLNFVLGIVEIKLCHDSHPWKNHQKDYLDPMRSSPVVYTYTSAFIVCGSILGVGVSFFLTEEYRLTEILGSITLFVDCFLAVVSLLCLILGGKSLVTHRNDDYNIPLGIPALFFCCFALFVLLIFSSRCARRRPPPHLDVEELDLSKLTDAQKSAYAKLITFNRKSNPGVSGEAVILLMEAYSQTTLEGMNCKVLRVFKKPKPENAGPGSKFEVSRTWETLDLEKTVFDEEETLFEYDEPPKPLSKNQRKKLLKKAAGEGSKFPLELDTEQDIKDKVKFHDDLMATEALVLLTTIELYDLTSTLTGPFGRFIQRNFGKDSYSKLLCVRFGLLAFHWPFVRSTFYTSNSQRPVARSAAVMYVISRWNKRQDSNKCTILLDPTYKNASPEQGIRFGGWYRVGLPASHIINLRPHKGENIAQYFKSIKYRNQDGEFQRAGGVTIEEKEVSQEGCETVMRLWRKIAEGRLEKGNTSVMVDPNAEFIRTIGTIANKACDRSLLFLKVNGEVIASCVLFRIGDTITSDLQGLDHEKARPMKAYFVMMQEVIKIALKEGKSFVDFGPTTEKPKLDIGCQNVPLTGALHTTSPILSMAVLIAAEKVNV